MLRQKKLFDNSKKTEKINQKIKKERKIMKTKIGICWTLLLVVYLLVAIGLGIILTTIWAGASTWIWWGIGTSLIIAVVSTLVLTARTVSHNEEAIVELFGEYYATWKAGLHFIFPFFGIIEVKDNAVFFMGEDRMNLFDGPYKDIPEDKKNSVLLVEFKGDASAYIEGAVFFKIIDSKKALYNIFNINEAIKTKMESAVNDFFGDKTFDEANEGKTDYDVSLMVDPDVISYIEENWGVKILRLAIEDFKLSEPDLEIRRKLFEAENNSKIAVIDAKTTVTKARAEKTSLELRGDGFSEQVASLVAKGVPREEAINYLGFLHKWTEIGKNDKSLIIDDSKGIAGAGAKFGKGFNKIN